MPDAACDALASAGPSSDEPVGAEATGNVRGRKKEAPAEQETAAEFTVNSVVGSRMVEGQLEYEVKWTREEVMPAHACLALGNCCFGGDLPTREVEMSTWELADDMYNCDGLIHDYHTLEPNSISAQRARSIAAGRAAAAELGLVAPVAAAAAGRALPEDAAAEPVPEQVPEPEPPGAAPSEANIATVN